MKVIPVCFCGNRRIFGGIFMTVLSMIKYTDAALEIILMTMDLSHLNPTWLAFTEQQRVLMEKTIQKKNPHSTVRIIDVTDLQMKYFDGGKNQKNNYTPYASIRLLLDLVDVPDKLVYLDADIMCCGNIEEYYDIDIEKYEFAATLDVVGRRFFKGNYCNSGVMLYNMPYIRRTGLFGKAREQVRKRTMLMPDQSALNKMCEAKLVLPYRFNEQREIHPDTVFKHFCMGFKWRGPILTSYNHKQWHRDMVHEKLHIHDFDDIYEEYDRIMEEENNKELIKI